MRPSILTKVQPSHCKVYHSRSVAKLVQRSSTTTKAFTPGLRHSPFDNPEIVVTVMIEGGGEGSAIAVPVAKQIFQWWGAGRTP